MGTCRGSSKRKTWATHFFFVFHLTGPWGVGGVTADLDISFSRVPPHSLARRQTSLKPRADCHLSMTAFPEIRKRRRHGRPWTSHLQSVVSAGLGLRSNGTDLLGESGRASETSPTLVQAHNLSLTSEGCRTPPGASVA